MTEQTTSQERPRPDPQETDTLNPDASVPGPDAYAAVAVTVLSWAAAFPLIGLAVTSVEPVPLAAARFATAALPAIAWLLWVRPPRPSLRDGLIFVVCGAIGIALYNVALNTGQRTVSPGAASFIVNTLPIVTALIAWVVLGERLGLRGWIGTAVSFAGIALIASTQPGGFAIGAGASLVFAAACCSAIYFVLQRPLVRRYGALACTAYTLIAGGVLLSPWLPAGVTQVMDGSGLDGFEPIVPPGETASGDTLVVAAIIAFLGLVSATLGYVTWAYALGRFGASRASNFLYLVPPVAVALTFAFTLQPPAVNTVIGGALAITGVALVNARRQR